jgi:tetratricopeptide (TPR) repeat protein
VKFLLALALVLAPCFGRAQGSFAASVSPGTCPPANQLRLLNLEQTTVLLEACEEVALFHAQRGAQLLAQGKVEEAAVALEKALLLDPNLPGAQLDYAQALALVGLKGSARAMLAEVLQRPDIQPALKAQLEKGASQNKLQAPATGIDLSGALSSALRSWQWSALAQTALGHETNLNSATYTDSLTPDVVKRPRQYWPVRLCQARVWHSLEDFAGSAGQHPRRRGPAATRRAVG